MGKKGNNRYSFRFYIIEKCLSHIKGRLKPCFGFSDGLFMIAAVYQYTSGSETVLWSRAER